MELFASWHATGLAVESTCVGLTSPRKGCVCVIAHATTLSLGLEIQACPPRLHWDPRPAKGPLPPSGPFLCFCRSRPLNTPWSQPPRTL